MRLMRMFVSTLLWLDPVLGVEPDSGFLSDIEFRDTGIFADIDNRRW